MTDTVSKTNPSISAHIAAARRAAHSALSEGSGHSVSAATPAGGRGIQRAKALYTHHRRSVLLAAAFAIVAMAAVRLIALHAPVVEKSELNAGPVKTAEIRASSDKVGDGVLTPSPRARPVDTTPTTSIAQLPENVRPIPRPGPGAPRRSFRPPCRRPSPRLCATRSSRARRQRNTNLPSGSLKGAECPRTTGRGRTGLNAPPPWAWRRPSSGWARSTARARGSSATPQPQSAGMREPPKPATPARRTISQSCMLNRLANRGLCRSREVVPEGRRIRRSRQRVQSRNPLCPRPRRRSGLPAVMALVLACGRPGRRGRGEEARRDSRRK